MERMTGKDDAPDREPVPLFGSGPRDVPSAGARRPGTLRHRLQSLKQYLTTEDAYWHPHPLERLSALRILPPEERKAPNDRPPAPLSPPPGAGAS
jgi:hypothetical protein